MLAKQLIAALPILKENVLQEAALQPQLFVKAARYRVSKMQERAEASATLEYLKAKIALRIRAQKNAQGDKITEGALKERVEVNKLIRAQRKVHDRSHEREELAKLILESFRMRRDAIRIIAEGQQAEGLTEMRDIERDVAKRKLSAEARKLEYKRRQVEKDEEDAPF